MAYLPPPADDKLPAFPKVRWSKPKTRFSGGLRRRWTNEEDGTIS